MVRYDDRGWSSSTTTSTVAAANSTTMASTVNTTAAVHYITPDRCPQMSLYCGHRSGPVGRRRCRRRSPRAAAAYRRRRRRRRSTRAADAGLHKRRGRRLVGGTARNGKRQRQRYRHRNHELAAAVTLVELRRLRTRPAAARSPASPARPLLGLKRRPPHGRALPMLDRPCRRGSPLYAHPRRPRHGGRRPARAPTRPRLAVVSRTRAARGSLPSARRPPARPLLARPHGATFLG